MDYMVFILLSLSFVFAFCVLFAACGREHPAYGNRGLPARKDIAMSQAPTVDDAQETRARPPLTLVLAHQFCRPHACSPAEHYQVQQ